MSNSKTMTTKDAADKLGVIRPIIYWLIDVGILRGTKLNASCWVFDVDDVDEASIYIDAIRRAKKEERNEN